MIKGRKSLISLVMVLMGITLGLTACGPNNSNTTYASVAPAAISPGDAIPNPSGDVVLTMSGNIANTNAGEMLEFDVATLESLGLVEYTILDPWLKSDVTYTGVLVSELVRYAGISGSAANLHMTALDDYEVDIPLSDVEKWPVLLVTRADGEHLTIEDSGPTRIVFPFGIYSDIDEVVYQDLAIWNLSKVEVQ